MSFYMLAVWAITPSLLLVWYFHRRDIYPEPPRVLWVTFGLGALAAVPIVAVALPLDWLVGRAPNYFVFGILQAFVVAAIPEELGKLAVLIGYSLRRREFDEPMDGVVYGVVASLGFATLENLLYIFGGGGGTVAIMRAFTSVPSHAFCGAIMGYYVGRARFEPWQSWRLTLTGLGAAILLHGLYDTPILVMTAFKDGTPLLPKVSDEWVGLLGLLALVMLVVGLRWCLALVKRARVAQNGGPGLAPPSLPPISSSYHPASRFGRALGLLMVAAGGLVASGGALVVLGISLAFAFGLVALDEATIIVGAAIIGLLPMGLGLWAFIGGIHRLNRHG
jgi:hypothetical protein